MTKRTLISLTVSLLLAVTAPLAAAQKSLDSSEIQNYLNSLQQIEPMADRISSGSTKDAAAMAQLWMEGDTSAVVNHLQDKEYYSDLASAVKEAGFDSVQEWVATAQQVTQAYMAVEMGEEGAVAAAEMQANIDKIKASPQFSEEQKKMMMEQFETMRTQLANIQDVSATDRKAIQPYMDQLRKHFEKQPAPQ